MQLITLSTLILLAATATAQQYTSTYTSSLGIAGTAGPNTTFGTKAKFDLTNGYKGSAVSATSRAEVIITHSKSRSGGLKVTIHEKTTSVWTSTGSRYPKAWTGLYPYPGGLRPNDTLLVLKSKNLIYGKLILSGKRTSQWVGLQTKNKCDVDVGGEGKIDFSLGVSQSSVSFPVTIDSKGLKVRTLSQTYAVAISRNSTRIARVDLTIEFVPLMATSSYGVSCGPKLTVSAQPGKARFAVINGKPGNWVLIFLGTKSISLKIGGTACFLHTDPILLLAPAQLNSLGDHREDVRLPPALKLDLKAQAATLDFKSMDIKTSRGVSVRTF